MSMRSDYPQNYAANCGARDDEEKEKSSFDVAVDYIKKNAIIIIIIILLIAGGGYWYYTTKMVKPAQVRPVDVTPSVTVTQPVNPIIAADVQKINSLHADSYRRALRVHRN